MNHNVEIMACRLKADVHYRTQKVDRGNVSILHWLMLMGQLRNIAKTMVTYGFNPIPDDPDIIKPVMKQYVELSNLIKSREENGDKLNGRERELYETITGNIVYDDKIKGTVVKKNRYGYDASRKATAMLAISNKTKKITMGSIELLYICHAAKIAFTEVNGDQKKNARLVKGKYKGSNNGSMDHPYRSIALQSENRCGIFKFTDFDPHEQRESQLVRDYHRLATTVFGNNVRKALKGTAIDKEARKRSDDYRTLIDIVTAKKQPTGNQSWTLDVEPFIPTISPEEGKEKKEIKGIAALRQQAVDDSWVALGVAYSLADAVTVAESGSKQQKDAINALKSYKEDIKNIQHELRFATTGGKNIKGKIDDKDEDLDVAVSGLAEKTEKEIQKHSPMKKRKLKKISPAATANNNSDAEEESTNITYDEAKSVIQRLWPQTEPIMGQPMMISCGNKETVKDILDGMAPEGKRNTLWKENDMMKVNLIRQQWTMKKVDYDEWDDCVELVEKEQGQQNKKAKK